MKGTFFIATVVIFAMLAIPLLSLKVDTNQILPASNTQNNVAYQSNKTSIGFDKIKVLKDDKILELSAKDYIFGVVAAEMPALYEEEALKAQAVAAYTFACYQKENGNNQNYDITSDPKTAQSFISREEAAQRWGEKAQEYTAKIDSCITQVLGQVITFDNKPIFAAYHAISSGSTNNCYDVWEKDLPYLKSVSSTGDCLAETYLSEVRYNPTEIEEKLTSVTAAQGEASDYFSEIVTAENGYVKSINYCGKIITGSAMCEALELRSSNFTVSFADNVFTFTVKGYGHGVGMSQNGANYMAKQGSSYEEILEHYYNNTTLQKNKKTLDKRALLVYNDLAIQRQ